MVEILGVMRHGDYEERDGKNVLSEEGFRNTIVVASFLKEFMERWYGIDYLQAGMSIVISSVSIRARQTAKVLSDILGLYHHIDESLGNEKGKAYLGSYVRQRLGNVLAAYRDVFLVTHHDQTSYLPASLLNRVKGDRSYALYSCCDLYTPDHGEWSFAYYGQYVYPPRGVNYESTLNIEDILLD